MPLASPPKTKNTARTAVFLTVMTSALEIIAAKMTAIGEMVCYLLLISRAFARHETRSVSLESLSSPAFIVVSRWASSGSDSQTNRMISAGSGSDRLPFSELTIPDVRPILSAFQVFPCSSLNVRMDIPRVLSLNGCQQV